MNTVKKRGTALLLALVLALSLAACGGGKADPKPAGKPAETQEPAGTPEDTQTPEPAQTPEDTKAEKPEAQDAAAPAEVSEPEPKALPEGPPTYTFENGVLICSGGGEVDLMDIKSLIGDLVFSSDIHEIKAAIEKIVVEWGITSLGKYAFAYTTNLKEVSLPDSLLWIGELSFSDATTLTSIEFPDSVTKLGASAFKGCKNLSNVKLSPNLEFIGEGAFLGCESLTSIEIPDSVSYIYARAFSESGLTECTLPKGLTGFGSGIFDECPIKSITVPEGAVLAKGDFGECWELTDITFHGDHGMSEIDTALVPLTRDFENREKYLAKSGEGTPHVLTIHADAGSTVEGWTNKNISEQGWQYIQFAAN